MRPAPEVAPSARTLAGKDCAAAVVPWRPGSGSVRPSGRPFSRRRTAAPRGPLVRDQVTRQPGRNRCRRPLRDPPHRRPFLATGCTRPIEAGHPSKRGYSTITVSIIADRVRLSWNDARTRHAASGKAEIRGPPRRLRLPVAPAGPPTAQHDREVNRPAGRDDPGRKCERLRHRKTGHPVPVARLLERR